MYFLNWIYIVPISYFCNLKFLPFCVKSSTVFYRLNFWCSIWIIQQVDIHYEKLKAGILIHKKQYHNECHRRIDRKTEEFAPRISDSKKFCSWLLHCCTRLPLKHFKKRWRKMPAFAVFAEVGLGWWSGPGMVEG